LESLTPMMKQYHEIKRRFKEEILFFRMGDFYEMFGEDAERASKLLEISLTKRNEIPMCGIPYHAKDNYLHKILKAGLKVAICDQLEDPSVSKGIVKRGVTEVITPGTLVDDRLLNQLGQTENNFIMALEFDDVSVKGKKRGLLAEEYCLAVAYVDISTGDFFVYEEVETNVHQAIVDKLCQVSPRELILKESLKEDSRFLKLLDKYQKDIPKNFIPDYRFDRTQGEDAILELLKVKTLKGFGVENKPVALGVAGALIYYLRETQLREISHLNNIRPVERNRHMVLNETSIRNLELVSNLHDGSKNYTLYSVLNESKTSMGGRMLHQWILNPLLDIDELVRRQGIVSYFIDHTELISSVQFLMGKMTDIERLIGKISLNKLNPRDLQSLKITLIFIAEIRDSLSDHPALSHYTTEIPSNQDMINLIQKAIMDEPAVDFSSGPVIQTGYHKELDDLRLISQQGKDYLIDLQEREKESLGISNLRIKYNKVIGYFIEVSKANSKHIPEHYIKKQSLTNVSRYTLPELTEYESGILGAQERILALEKELFDEVRLLICEHISSLKKTSQLVAELDILVGFAYLALNQDYCRPELHTKDELILRDARHPVVEKHLIEGDFIPNDLQLNKKESRILIITGPNMAGKSTYLRQSALLSVMAQIGSFIPAQYGKLALVDRIFTRIGASDNLARGESTFLVEMIETAIILNNATEKSLVIMDEIGRGTSTYDGLSIAWSIVEYLSSPKRNMGKVLFATHYHELTALAREKGIQNFQVLVREWGDEIIFMHKVKEGAGGKSFGIQVARLAGLPKEVLQRAKVILADLENRNYEVEEDLLSHSYLKNKLAEESRQQDLFPKDYDSLAREVLKLDPEASHNIIMKRITRLQEKIRKGEI